MKPLISETQDIRTLQELGRASVQIVHDLKNQLNGLKLYATFLRKRMEKSDRPQDEQETIAKLIAGLERAAADMTTLVRYGRPLELRRQPHVDLVRLLSNISAGEGVHLESEANTLEGEFDAASMTEALKAITTGAQQLRSPEETNGALSIHLRRDEAEGGTPAALIEWRNVKTDTNQDPFHSFAGGNALRMSLAAKIIEAHGGETGQQQPNMLQVRLPLKERDER
jgi:hypothetical protein